MNIHLHQFYAIAVIAWITCLFTPQAGAQVNTGQINWGSLDFSSIVDSNGNTLAADNFTFDLGAFNDDFTPTDSTVADWFANWHTIDRATYNEAGGVFAGQYTMFGNTYTDTDNGNFAGLGISRDAYVWVYNSTAPEPGTEWFIARASNWQFPDITDDCCNNELPLEWSMSDLQSTDVPLWGNQLGTEGPGERNEFISGADLQTYTFIPEPSSALLIALAGMLGVMRRSRPQA